MADETTADESSLPASWWQDARALLEAGGRW